jgi:hypothetical protein
MPANFMRWTLDDAQIFSLRTRQGSQKGLRGVREQQFEEPSGAEFARFTDEFGNAWKVFFIIGDSMRAGV